MVRDFLCILRGQNFAPFPIEFRLFPNFEKNPNHQKKFLFFLGGGGDLDFHSVITHKQSTTIASCFSFNIFMAKICVIAYMLFIDQNDIIMHYNKFPNIGFYHANFYNLKGPKAPTKNCNKKIPDGNQN